MVDAYGPPILKVERTQDNIPVVLVLHQRLDVPPIFHTVSWRTRYSEGGSNRRFYWLKDGPWTLRLNLAREMLEEAQSKGMLAAQFDDRYERFDCGLPAFINSNDAATSAQRAALWPEITLEGQESNWESQQFVIGTEPGGLWRKIMLVNATAGLVTFRSCTQDASYGLRLRLPSSSKWYMDRAMQDASTAVMRRFLEFLRQLP